MQLLSRSALFSRPNRVRHRSEQNRLPGLPVNWCPHCAQHPTFAARSAPGETSAPGLFNRLTLLTFWLLAAGVRPVQRLDSPEIRRVHRLGFREQFLRERVLVDRRLADHPHHDAILGEDGAPADLITARFEDARTSVIDCLAKAPVAAAGSAFIGRPLLVIIVTPRIGGHVARRTHLPDASRYRRGRLLQMMTSCNRRPVGFGRHVEELANSETGRAEGEPCDSGRRRRRDGGHRRIRPK